MRICLQYALMIVFFVLFIIQIKRAVTQNRKSGILYDDIKPMTRDELIRDFIETEPSRRRTRALEFEEKREQYQFYRELNIVAAIMRIINNIFWTIAAIKLLFFMK